MKKIILSVACALLLGMGVSHAQLVNLHSFTYDSYTYGTPILVGNVLYGMTDEGGPNGDGNIYSVNTDGSNYKDLYDFADTGSKAFHCNGDEPYGSLTLVGNTLFGLLPYGGLHDDGMVFSIHTDGSTYRDLWDFSDTGSHALNEDGYDPYGTLTAIGSKLYGTTEEGGFNGAGTIFSIDTSYTKDTARLGYKELWDFNYNLDSNGAYPYYVGLKASTNGKVLYGTTYEGGKHDEGNIFSIHTDGSHYKDLHDFLDNSYDGGYPYGGVTLVGGKLYGVTESGGWDGYGIVYSLDTDGTAYMPLYAFNYDSGSYAYGELVVAGNMIYGTTEGGGTHNDGTLFAIDINGNNHRTLVNFDYYNNGEEPEYGMLAYANGSLYGTTESGGGLGGGTLFRYDLCGYGSTNLTTLSTPDSNSNKGTATVVATGTAPSPYTYMWSPGGQTNATATGLSAGSYIVTVTSAFGCQTSTRVVVGSSLGVNNITANAAVVSVYPNPSNGNVTISVSGTSDKSSVEVYNTMGQLVYTGALASGNNSIDLNTKSNGVYLYRIVTETGDLIGSGKLVIQK